MRIYLGPWQWRNVSGFNWNPPVEATSSVDLRNIASAAAPGPVAQGHGIFITELPIATPGYTQLATDPFEILSNPRRNTIRNTLGLPNAIASTRLNDIVYELMTVHSDITSGVICPPLMPTPKGMLEFSFAGIRRSVIFSDSISEWSVIQKSLQSAYRQYKTEGEQGTRASDFHRRTLSVWMENYKIADFTKFIPSDLPIETPLPHGTSFSEDFNQADSTTVGPQLTWSEIVTDWRTESNVLRVAFDFNDSHIRAQHDVGSADHYSQVVLVARPGGGMGVSNRFSSSATTCYQAWSYTDGNVYFSKTVAGTRTNLTSTAQSFSANDTLKVNSSGSSHDVIYNGSTIIAAFSDSAISTGTRGGCFAGGAADGCQWDSFIVDDGLGAAAAIKQLAALGVG